MIKLLRVIKSWHARKRRERQAYFWDWDKDTPLESLRTALMYDDQDRIDYTLGKLTSNGKLTLADDQKALYDLILKCAQYSSSNNLEILISFWTGEHKERTLFRTPIHQVIYNRKHSKYELWELLLKFFSIDIHTNNGITALADAASSGTLEDIDLLIQFGANPIANLIPYEGLYPLALALFFNDDRAAFQKLLKLAANSRSEEIELLNKVLFSVCAYPFHAGEYPGEKRISDMEYLASLGASFDYTPDGEDRSGLFLLESSEFKYVLEPLIEVVEKSNFDLIHNPNNLARFMENGRWDRPKAIKLLCKYGANFNSGHQASNSYMQPVWFGVLKFRYSMPDDWLSVAKELLRGGISLELKDSEGRDFSDIRVLPGKTKLDKYNVLNQLKTLGLSSERYSEAITELNIHYPDK